MAFLRLTGAVERRLTLQLKIAEKNLEFVKLLPEKISLLELKSTQDRIKFASGLANNHPALGKIVEIAKLEQQLEELDQKETPEHSTLPRRLSR